MSDEKDGAEMMRIAVCASAHQAVVRPAGELDISTGQRLERALVDAAGTGTRVVLDLRDLHFIDATGLRVIIAAKKRLGADLAVQSPSDPVRRVLGITRLHQVLGLRVSAPGAG